MKPEKPPSNRKTERRLNPEKSRPAVDEDADAMLDLISERLRDVVCPQNAAHHPRRS
jgi:hypothetical protein